MNNLAVLVVYFSRTGRTEKVAKEIVDHFDGSKKEAIQEPLRREGPLGYVRSLWESLVGSTPIIQRPHNNPKDFDLVVLASPVWMSRVASPMRTYLTKMESAFPRVAFAVTEGGSGGNRALLQMRDLCSKIPEAELVITEDDMTKGRHIHHIRQFCEQIESKCEKQVAAPPVPLKKSSS